VHIVVCEFMEEASLKNFGEDVSVTYDSGLVDDQARLYEHLSTADAVIVRNRTQVDTDFLSAAPKLKVVGRLGVGLDNIDLEACRARGIEVCPATGANTLSVAEYVISTAMTLTRGAFSSNNSMISGDWPRASLGKGGEVSGRVMGLFGFGEIAQAVAASAKSLGMEIAAHDPFLPMDHPAWVGIKNCTAAELLSQADILSLHVPLTKKTRGMIGDNEIATMKPGAILINTARGGIVDEQALADALMIGHLGGAALDVFSTEPLTTQAGTIFEDTPNLILTPHIAGVTGEGNIRVSHATVQNVARVLFGA
jgi:(S)-sulfolactate dehydrogenase